jgi:hypothetical protein
MPYRCFYDAMARLQLRAKAGQVLTQVAAPGQCPDCLGALEFSEGATLCRACGFSSTA